MMFARSVDKKSYRKTDSFFLFKNKIEIICDLVYIDSRFLYSYE